MWRLKCRRSPTPPLVGPYRGAGRPEAILLMERLVDVAAHDMGIDPLELRRRNLIRKRSVFPITNAVGTTYDSGFALKDQIMEHGGQAWPTWSGH